MQEFHQKIKFIKQEIKKWNQEAFGDITAEKNVLELKMKETRQKIIQNGLTEETKKLEMELQEQWEDRVSHEETL